jgi:Yip1 domain
MASFTERIVGAARLDTRIYEEVEADPNAMGQAMATVALAAIAAGIGAVHGPGPIVSLLGAFIGWFAWALLTFFIGTKLLPEPQTRADLGQLLRTTGFSAAPGMLRVLGIVPILGRLAVVVASIWQLVAMVVAVRQALDYTSTGRAIAVCLIGFLVYVAIALFLGLFVGLGAALLGGVLGR